MIRTSPVGLGLGPTFAPRYVHSAFQLEALWVRAAKGVKLPGSAFFVLHYLLACQAKGQGGQTRKGIAKASNVCLGSVKNGVKRLLAEGWITDGPGGLEVKLFERRKCPDRGQDLTPPIHKEDKRAESSNAPHEAPKCPMPAPTEPEKLPSSDPVRPIAEALLSAGLDTRGAWSTARRVNPGVCPWQELLAAAQLLVNQRTRVRNPKGLLAHLVTRKGKSARRVLENAVRGPRVKLIATKTPAAAHRASHAFLAVPGALEALALLERASAARAALSGDAPGFLEALDAETRAQRQVEEMARQALGVTETATLEDQLRHRLESIPAGALRERARRIHLGRALLAAVGLAA